MPDDGKLLLVVEERDFLLYAMNQRVREVVADDIDGIRKGLQELVSSLCLVLDE